MNSENHTSAFTLERLLADDLPTAQRQQVEMHIGDCADCRAALSALQADVEAFQAEVPYASFRIEHEARKDKATSKPFWLRTLLPSLATAAAVAGAALLVVVGGEPQTLEDPGTRIKGAAAALHFAVVDAGGLRLGTPGELLRPGAQLQLSYEAGDNSHIGVFGIDAAGSVAVLFPKTGALLAPLPAGREGRLPFSLMLDATAGAERFIAVFAKDAAALQPVRSALEGLAGQDPATLGPLQLPGDLKQSSVWIRKGP